MVEIASLDIALIAVASSDSLQTLRLIVVLIAAHHQ